MEYVVEEDVRTKKLGTLKSVMKELIEEYEIDVSKYDKDDSKIHNLIMSLENSNEMSFKNFCRLLDIFKLNVSIEIEGNPAVYPDKRNEIYSFSIKLPDPKPYFLEVKDDDDILVRFIKRNMNSRNLTADYFKGRVSEIELKSLITILENGTMSTKVFEKFCKILQIDPVLFDTNSRYRSDDSVETKKSLTHDIHFGDIHDVLIKDYKPDARFTKQS